MSILSSFVGYAWLLWIYYIYSFTRCVWMDRLTALIHTGGICSSFSLWFCVCARVCICWIACWTAHFFWCMRICELYDCDYVHTCFECSPSQFTILYTHTLNHSFINLQDRLNDGHTTIAVHNIKLIFIMSMQERVHCTCICELYIMSIKRAMRVAGERVFGMDKMDAITFDRFGN